MGGRVDTGQCNVMNVGSNKEVCGTERDGIGQRFVGAPQMKIPEVVCNMMGTDDDGALLPEVVCNMMGTDDDGALLPMSSVTWLLCVIL